MLAAKNILHPEREQLGSVGRQTTFFIILKVVVIGSGVGGCPVVDVGDVTAPSCTQVALFSG